jgi:hypothetical protein
MSLLMFIMLVSLLPFPMLVVVLTAERLTKPAQQAAH